MEQLPTEKLKLDLENERQDQERSRRRLMAMLLADRKSRVKIGASKLSRYSAIVKIISEYLTSTNWIMTVSTLYYRLAIALLQ